MPNYQQGKIYAIKSHNSDLCYIGSTTKKYLCQRYGNHTVSYNKYLNGEDVNYCSSFEILSFNDTYIELLELCPCNSVDELHKKEAEWILKSNNVNIQKNSFDKKEYQSRREIKDRRNETQRIRRT